MAISSRPNLNDESQSHEWVPTSTAGTRFVTTSNRGPTSICLVYALEDTIVYWDDGNVNVSDELDAFTFGQRSNLNFDENLVKIKSTKPVVLSCFNSDDGDFINVIPVTTERVYGWVSQNLRGFHGDCDTLEPRLNNSYKPSCFYSTGSSVNIGIPGNLFFEEGGGSSLYSGNSVYCDPQPGECISAYSIADGNGGEGGDILFYDVFNNIYSFS